MAFASARSVSFFAGEMKALTLGSTSASRLLNAWAISTAETFASENSCCSSESVSRCSDIRRSRDSYRQP